MLQMKLCGDLVLRTKCTSVGDITPDLLSIMDEMVEMMRAQNGVGLAAPQVGILRRVVVVRIDDTYIELVNPVIKEVKGEQVDAEGCLSLPGVCGTVKRPNYVKVSAQDRHGCFFDVGGEGLMARAFCHEIDHLDGILFADKATEMFDVE